MQAILTKYLPYTDTLPSRISVSCQRATKVYSVHSLPDNSEENQHHAAARKLCAEFVEADAEKYGDHSCIGSAWAREFVTGASPVQGQYFHVALPKKL